jgi:hypothetical protein
MYFIHLENLPTYDEVGGVNDDEINTGTRDLVEMAAQDSSVTASVVAAAQPTF